MKKFICIVISLVAAAAIAQNSDRMEEQRVAQLDKMFRGDLNYHLEQVNNSDGTYNVILSFRQEYTVQGGSCIAPWHEMKFVDLYHGFTITYSTEEEGRPMRSYHEGAIPGWNRFIVENVAWAEGQTAIIEACSTTRSHCTTLDEVPVYLDGEPVNGRFEIRLHHHRFIPSDPH